MIGYLVVESVEEDVVEVELDSGLRTELPLAWLPAPVEEGAGYRTEAHEGTLSFVPDERAVRLVRERNKQTLLEFSDELD